MTEKLLLDLLSLAVLACVVVMLIGLFAQYGLVGGALVALIVIAYS